MATHHTHKNKGRFPGQGQPRKYIQKTSKQDEENVPQSNNISETRRRNEREGMKAAAITGTKKGGGKRERLTLKAFRLTIGG